MIDPQIYASAFERNPDGKKCMDELCFMFLNRLSYSKGDPTETAFNEGKRAVLFYIQNQIRAAKQQPQGDENDN